MVRDAVHGDGGAAVDGACRDREADPGGDVRVKAGRALREGDLLGADRVPGTGRRQRVGDDVEDRGAAGGGRGPGRGRPGPGGTAAPSVRRPGFEHRHLGEEGPAQAGGAPAARAVELGHRVGQPPLAVGEPGGEPGTGAVVLRQPRERRPGDSRLVHREAERGEPGWRPLQCGKRATAVPRAPQRGGPAVGAREPDQAAQRCRQRPPGERHRAHRVIGHVPQHHGCGEHDRSRRRRYSHAGRYYRRLAARHGGP